MIALEALSMKTADLSDGVVRAHVLRWVHDYALRRGVVLADSDIESELAELRGT